jgi:hypothetical protein
MFSGGPRRLVAATLVLMTVFVTMPLSAADFSTSKTVIGSVSAVGPVELRGIAISQEGTLFPGDSIRTSQRGFAKVLLGSGKIELLEKTNIQVNRDAQGVKVAMNAGMIGFSAHTPLRIDVLPFELIATDDSSGNLAILPIGAAALRTINGKVTVRNVNTSESFVLVKGQEMLLSLKKGVPASSLLQLASNGPTPMPSPTPSPAPLPAPTPQGPPPAGKTSGINMDTGAWFAVIGVLALGGVAIWGIVTAINNGNDIDDLKRRIAALEAASPTRP